MSVTEAKFLICNNSYSRESNQNTENCMREGIMSVVFLIFFVHHIN
jgi:hypothetical protein